VPVRKMVKQIPEGENIQLLLEHICTQRTYTFQVFNGIR
jgi:hypothetical protein